MATIQPDVKLEFAPAVAPLTLPTAGQWVDVTGYAKRIYFKRGREDALSQVRTGILKVDLLNTDRRFDPFPYSSGPYGSGVKRGRRWRLQGEFNGTDYPLIQTFAERYRPSYPARYGALMHVESSDAFWLWAKQEVTTTRDEELSGARLVALLDEGGWPGTGLYTSSGFRAIDTGLSNVVGIELVDDFLLDPIRDVGNSVQGMVFVAKDGTFTFLDRHRAIHPGRGYFSAVASFGDDSTAVSAPVFTGGGLDDLSVGGAFTGTGTTHFRVQIDGTGTPDTFRWSDDGGATWTASAVAITGSAQTLTDGVTITFGATTGHTDTDTWDFYAGGIAYRDLGPATNEVYNRVRITPAGGEQQEVSDASSISDYTESTKTLRASLLASANEAYDFAVKFLNQNKSQYRYYPSLTFGATGDSSLSSVLWPLLFSLDLGQKVLVTHNPPGGGSPWQTFHTVEGIEGAWSLQAKGWEYIKLFLSVAPIYSYCILNSAVYGRLNTTARLAW